MTIDQQIQQLSQMTGISVADVRCMCQGVVNSMIDDGVTLEIIEQAQAAQIDIVGAYMQHQCRKTEMFVTTYMTRGREAFAESMLTELRGAA
jgi:predicted small secreted protein